MQGTFEGIYGASCVLSSAGLAEGTNANTFKISASDPAGVHFAINGLMYYKANTDNIAFSAGHTAQAVLTTCLYLVQIDSGGNVTTKQGNIELNANLVNDGVALNFPTADADRCALGVIRVHLDNAAVFTAAATDLGASDVVDTYLNFAFSGPGRPLGA